MRLALLMVIVAGLLGACGKAPAGKDAKAAAELVLPTLLQAPQASLSGWSDLRGRLVVLEFWATWCDPCVEEIPHINGLIDKLAGKPVVFISISDEPREKVEPFLKAHPMKGWVAADAKAAFASFGVHSRPHTVIVGPDGRLLGSTYPGFLTADNLEQALEGKPLPRFESAEDAGIGPPSVSGGGALFEARVSSASGGKMSMESSEDFFHGRGLEAGWLLSQAFGVNQARIVMEPPVNGNFDVDVVVPRGQGEKLGPAFQLAAQAALGLTLKRQTRSTEVFVLAKAAALKMKQSPGKNGKRGFSTGPGRITAQGMSLSDLSTSLEDWLDKPVLDETGLKGRYDFELTWDRKKPDSLIAALESQLGLKATKAKRPMELLVFFKADKR